MLPRHTGTKVDKIPLEKDGTMTYAGHAYYEEVQGEGGERGKHAAEMLRTHGTRLHDHAQPKRPEQRDGEDDARFAKRKERHERAMEKRREERKSAFGVIDATDSDIESLAFRMLMDHEHVDEPAMWPQILQAFKRSGEFIWRDDGVRRGAGDYRTPHIGKPAVEYIRFPKIRLCKQSKDISSWLAKETSNQLHTKFHMVQDSQPRPRRFWGKRNASETR